jgi:hypothetical protein
MVRIGTDERYVALEGIGRSYGGDDARVSFAVGGLIGAWKTNFQQIPAFTQALSELHSKLAGDAQLSDSDSVGLSVAIDKRGGIAVLVDVDCGWSFGIDGHFSFNIDLDQSYLPEIIASLNNQFPATPQ